MTSMINHWNEELFPNPDEFIPERWLIDNQPNYKLQKHLLSFGKGTRSCLGEQYVTPGSNLPSLFLGGR